VKSELGHPSGNIEQTQNMQKTMISKIGGIGGLGSSEAKAVVTL